MLEILYQDEHLVAVNKPSGLLVHRSLIDKHETQFAMQMVRDQIGQYVYPVHRLDRPTSGVLLMALSSETAKLVCAVIEARKMSKTYYAISRGHTPEQGIIDKALIEQPDKISDKKMQLNPPAKEAVTQFETLAKSTLDIEINRYPQSRFSLVKLMPIHGRKHQIRRHLAHLRHPILGDVNYGDNKYNRYLRDQLNQFRLALHAAKVEIPHPITGEMLTITAGFDQSFQQILQLTQLPMINEENL
ncbi:tRNA pseudouridine(65) synthase TruC [Catenovulum agarivorans]|uniref:tRNA pseudouridine(65) synthase TruC n=1 Tax=Catenovulum agarivorans TaxID=1172192 RepID=UPI0002E4F6B3|nr:tRNA pseudouridine(65) synthase TruC [Catenovulum agarivorans]